MRGKILKDSIIGVIAIIIISFIIIKLVLIRSVEVKVLDKETNSPIQNVKVSFSHYFLADFDGSGRIKQALSDKNGKAGYSFLRGEKVGGAVFYKEGYYPNKCYFGNLNTCSNPIYLTPVNNPVDLTYEIINYDDQLGDKGNSLEINKSFSLYGQNDINLTFSKNGKEFYFPRKITFYGQGGIQLASRNNESGLLNITIAPQEGYSSSLSIDNQEGSSYIFRTVDGKHYGKFYLNYGPILEVFLNPNENDRNLEYKLPSQCLGDVLTNPYASVELDPARCN